MKTYTFKCFILMMLFQKVYSPTYGTQNIVHLFIHFYVIGLNDDSHICYYGKLADLIHIV